jgi:hypothetical protein
MKIEPIGVLFTELNIFFCCHKRARNELIFFLGKDTPKMTCVLILYYLDNFKAAGFVLNQLLVKIEVQLIFFWIA